MKNNQQVDAVASLIDEYGESLLNDEGVDAKVAKELATKIVKKLVIKTKYPVRDNFDPDAKEMRARLAVHLLADFNGEIDIILMADTNLDVYLVAAVQNEMDDDEKIVNGESVFTKRPKGTVQYQVSDGLPGNRSSSNDYHNLAQAIHGFKEIVDAGGWTFWAQERIEAADGTSGKRFDDRREENRWDGHTL